MTTITLAFKKITLFTAALLLLVAYPLPAFAEDIASDPPTTTSTTQPVSPEQATPTIASDPPKVTAEQPAVSSPQSDTSPKQTASNGPSKPNGADATTYRYNDATGVWENDHYTWNPSTGQTQPKNAQSYSFNPQTGLWDTTKWVYDAPSGKYVPNVVSTNVAPQGIAASIDQTGPNSTNTVASNGADNHAFDLFFNGSISNNINSTARTGNIGIGGNTIAGNASTGDATSISNVINLLQSAASLTGTNLATFSSNINGDVLGDLFIDPYALSKVQPTSGSNQLAGDLKVNYQANGQINNAINLDANSGNVNASRNTQTGDVATGNANAVANVVNAINSVIAAKQSFLGVVNINGNLNGDILLPPDMLKTLLSSNTPTATIDTSALTGGDTLATFTDNQAIQNQVATNAQSGAINTSDNTTVGSLSSGNSKTNLTVLNLTGRQVVGDDALLVFINVLGKWVGVIMDAPSGSTAAALGDGITQNKLASNSGDTDITATNNNQINNAITANARSGDASVTKNTEVGNVTTGNATASANLLNIINSNLSLSNFLGILFINVFGTWNGSFGIDTAAGTIPGVPAPANSHQASTENIKVFKFTPSTEGRDSITPVQLTGYTLGANVGATSATNGPKTASAQSSTPPTTLSSEHITIKGKASQRMNAMWIPAIGGIAGGLLLAAERILSNRQQKATTKKVQ